MFTGNSIVEKLISMKEDGVAEEFLRLSRSKSNHDDKIPQFYQNIITNPVSLAITSFAYKNELITNEDLNALHTALQLESGSSIPYSDFCNSGIFSIISSEKHYIFDDNILGCFKNDTDILHAANFYEYIKNLSLLQKAIYDLNKIEPINETQTISLETLKKFILQRIISEREAFPSGLPKEWFRDYYFNYVLNRILFDTDNFHPNIITINDLLDSEAFNDFLCLLDNEDDNLVSYDTVTKIWNQFQEITTDRPNLVYKDQMKDIYHFQFTDAFIDRLYQFIPNIEDYTNFQGFMKLLFSLRYSDTGIMNSSIFFFKILDVDGDGIVSLEDMQYFYKGMVTEMAAKVDFSIFSALLVDFIGVGKNITLEDLNSSERKEDFIFGMINKSKFIELFALYNE